MRLKLKNLQETQLLGRILGELAVAGDIICLEGDLGAGKTTLTQALALGLGVEEDNYVTSPSFAILQEYEGRAPLYHFDFYRLGDSAEVEEQGFSEYFFAGGVCVIEWPQAAEASLPPERLTLTLIIDMDIPIEEDGENNSRIAQVEGTLKEKDFLKIFQQRLDIVSISYI
ncbi:tRNA (adenosine(37)-N6)-threonylcarbamoyltransferase complex ATPase subunit type 1 TsaE [Desulforhopalus vacuolatus]|uniref:tRNA (adenosine(37)-N6)-threonylcarbamoyltransferase complex ATPase subunit type 1 TsaE n=1 Tax=Desulforhopalus vacuolatus TaxID=40414 RepID=UPI001962746A|nr:tRNA (adenosine(37)-N6)-threonylcarbamoyltransferase complex ATPase subunit type 1 TsaE [Desulforhopalus vacuolatus]MBM9519015.1 tRNA (adenosine(37)-N6)-threonylcarbamoyltransferase complex ATPase subunit type 1 TsaE [Desulforhopalus vacuolatus]